MKKIIIDTDPGVDDALAIAFGIKASLPIESIACVYGNSTIENSVKNTLTVLELTGLDVPVYQGADKPLKGQGRLAEGHGENGLGGFSVASSKTVSKLSAVEHYQDLLDSSPNGDISIIAIGPTTNLGSLLEKSPKLFQKVKKIVVMGGVFGERGNVTPYAEFNVYNDPLALQLILSSGHPEIILVPANICRQVIFDQTVFDKINNPRMSAGLSKISQFYIDYYSNDKEFGGFNGGVMYDLLAVAMFVDEKLFRLSPANVQVETLNVEKYGLTEIIKGKPNCKVVTGIDPKSLEELYVRIMNN